MFRDHGVGGLPPERAHYSTNPDWERLETRVYELRENADAVSLVLDSLLRRRPLGRMTLAATVCGSPPTCQVMSSDAKRCPNQPRCWGPAGTSWPCPPGAASGP